LPKNSFDKIYISSGKYKGKKIFLPNIPTTRVSKSIVRKSIFDTLQNEVFNVVFIEMFAGSGSVGFEALSRGASKIIFFENNPIAIQTLKKNSQTFPDENIEIIVGDSFENLPNKINKIDEKIIIYIDPPFSIRKDMENIYKKVYDLFNQINDSKIEIAILEQLSDEVAPEILGNLINSKNKKFGKTTLRYFKKQ